MPALISVMWKMWNENVNDNQWHESVNNMKNRRNDGKAAREMTVLSMIVMWSSKLISNYESGREAIISNDNPASQPQWYD